MALGKIKTDTLEHSTAGSLDTQFVVKGTCKSWLNATIDSNTHTVQGSFNVSSLTDDGAGRTDTVFTNNMNDIRYAIASSCSLNGSNFFSHLGNNDLQTTGEYRINTCGDGGTIADYDNLNNQVQGDLA